MAGPFPGVDPYVESQLWEPFHSAFLNAIVRQLTSALRPRYAVLAEKRVYLEHSTGNAGIIKPDVSVLRTAPNVQAPRGGGVAAAEPITVRVPMPERVEERFLRVVRLDSQQLVSIVELLSPGNKRPGSVGRDEYMRKRDEILASSAHLVELDLLRGGARLPMADPMPPADCYAIVSRFESRPNADVYWWEIDKRLPTVRVPLVAPDPDAELDLQSAYVDAYESGGFDYTIDYDAPLLPKPSSLVARWVAECLTSHGGSTASV